MVEDRVKTNAVNGDAVGNGHLHLLANVAEPAAAQPVFRARFRHIQRSAISLVDLGQYFAERTEKWIGPFEGLEFANTAKVLQIVNPLVVRIEIHPDGIEETL